jgi:hypothetical protein
MANAGTDRRLDRWAMGLVVPALVVAGACERGITDHDDHEHMVRVELIDRGQANRPVVATWVRGQGWQGEIPVLNLAERPRLSIGVNVYDSDNRQIIDRVEYSVRYAVRAGAPQGVVDMNHPPNVLFHGDHVHIYGAAPGTTQIEFVLWHVDHADGVTDPIDFRVIDFGS